MIKSDYYKETKNKYTERFIRSGISDFSNEEILEFLLTYSAKGTLNEKISKKLLDDFGSLSAVFEAPVKMLENYGLNDDTIMLIKLLPDMSRKYVDDKFITDEKKYDNKILIDKISSAFIGAEGEQVILILKDKNDKEVFFGVISKGSINASEVYIRGIIDLAVQKKACYAYISHNHPSGVSYPSDKDIKTTIKLKRSLSAIGVELMDHFIVAGTSVFSMANDENYFDIFF